MEEKIGKRNWHDELMASGVLGVLKAWIEPLPDGNLPNIKVQAFAGSTLPCTSIASGSTFKMSYIQCKGVMSAR